MATETSATDTAAPTSIPLAVTGKGDRSGLRFSRHFTTEDVHPYGEVDWESRDAVIINWRDGTTSFEQRDVEFPTTWSMNATTIVAQKYFRGTLGTPARERSVKQMIDRVADTITGWGMTGGYFSDDASAEVFRAELKHLLVHQKAAFNSPVWFNVGVDGSKPQCSACFILSVEDTMSSILNWYVEEGTIFKGGSGAGVNLSPIRSSRENLKGGGEASGPVSFMRGADASAGTIKSGGKTRRAAKMVILNVDHPDIEEFIWTKAREEDKIRVLREAGFDMDLDGADYASVQYQNANNSVRVTDEFMQAWVDDGDYDVKAVTTGEVLERKSARDVMRQFAEAAWACADPGMQYDTTINDWHTTPNSGRINGSNPCFPAGTEVATEEGPLAIEVLAKRADAGQALPRVWSFDERRGVWELRDVQRAWKTQVVDQLAAVRLSSGVTIRCTTDHRFLTEDRGWIEAAQLRPGESLVARGSAGVAGVDVESLDEPQPVYDLAVNETHTFAVVAGGVDICVHNCSEYMHLDNSACNLASLNLKEFYDYEAGHFDIEAFKRAVEVIFTAQEIIVGFSSYPTEPIGKNAVDYRQLGLGYANLGGLLMSLGLPYDSDEGRAFAGAITALMTGHAYACSTQYADVVGPFAGYEGNEQAMLRVIRKHRAGVDDIDASLAPTDLVEAARLAWDAAIIEGEANGFRNAQATVTAPTGTIGLMMDCDTTGIEPDLGLVKTKKLVGGGSMQFVNQTVPQALKSLGYEPGQIDQVIAHIDEHKTIQGAPGLKDEHLKVFQCAMGDDPIHYMGHVRMMSVIQPFISGALSKTVNLPEEATVEEIEQLHVDAWQLGIKAIAIYRDNCKVAQPLSVARKSDTSATASAEAPSGPAAVAAPAPAGPVRRKLPKQRPSQTISFRVGEAKGYLTAGEYPGDGLGEIFVKLGKQGSTLSGLLDAFAIAVSIGLQYGVPLETYVRKFMNMRFEPAGMTDDPEIRFSTSLVDYTARKLAIEYLPFEVRDAMGIHTLDERQAMLEEPEPVVPTAPTAESVAKSAELPKFEGSSVPVDHDAPMCFSCGVKMKRAGSCHVCESCGSTSGCS